VGANKTIPSVNVDYKLDDSETEELEVVKNPNYSRFTKFHEKLFFKKYGFLRQHQEKYVQVLIDKKHKFKIS